MILEEKEFLVPLAKGHCGLLEHFATFVLREGGVPVRFVVTEITEESYRCEMGVLSDDISPSVVRESIFHFQRRAYENTSQFIAVLVVPTGIGAELGGHSGDAGPLARLIAGACDKLVTHPNVVNAADINELPDNGLYVEGSVISRLMMGTIGLQEVRSNRVLAILDQHPDPSIFDFAVNSISAARAALGLDCLGVVTMQEGMILQSMYSGSGRAVGRIEYLERLFATLDKHAGCYDAIALSTLICVPEEFHADYFSEDIVNPWGGVEAMLTHAISLKYNLPSAHSPMMSSVEVMNLDVGRVDPRKAAEAVSTTYLHCILKGLHRSPRIIPGLPYPSPGLITSAEVSCLIIPDGCVGLPTLAALEQGIPVIAVRENLNCMKNCLEDLPFTSGKLFVVENYLEAVGVMAALKSGVTVASVRRPFH